MRKRRSFDRIRGASDREVLQATQVHPPRPQNIFRESKKNEHQYFRNRFETAKSVYFYNIMINYIFKHFCAKAAVSG
jgi:hypothetical protein